jgi:hypothetical protein
MDAHLTGLENVRRMNFLFIVSIFQCFPRVLEQIQHMLTVYIFLKSVSYCFIVFTAYLVQAYPPVVRHGNGNPHIVR